MRGLDSYERVLNIAYKENNNTYIYIVRERERERESNNTRNEIDIWRRYKKKGDLKIIIRFQISENLFLNTFRNRFETEIFSFQSTCF